VDARKEALDADPGLGAFASGQGGDRGQGKGVRPLRPGGEAERLTARQAIGPTGNLRAPTFRAGDEFVIGFNPELYESWLK